jgi:hypothetical protein
VTCPNPLARPPSADPASYFTFEGGPTGPVKFYGFDES